MLKLKKIDLLTKNDKIHNKLEHGCCDHKSTRRWLVLRRGGYIFFFFVGVVVCSLGGESWDREEDGEIGEERVDSVVIY